MKTTKIFISVLLGFLALALCSCDSAEYRPTDGNCAFVIKKIDGKRQWGIASKSGKKIYIPCQYDSIFSAYGAPYDIDELFVGIKDGKMYALDTRDGELLGGRGFTSLASSYNGASHNISSFGGGALYHEAETDKGIMFFHYTAESRWVECGPAEAMLSEGSILCKKHGKWGIYDAETNQEYIPCIYDEIISVYGAYYWGKKDGKWSAFTRNGQPIKASATLLNKYLQMPSMDNEQYQREQNSVTFRKISIEGASYIAVNPWKVAYIPW